MTVEEYNKWRAEKPNYIDMAKRNTPGYTDKLLTLSDKAIKVLSIEALKQNTVFKLYVEQLLEDKAKELENKK